MKEIYIYPHMQMGDQIIINGLVRNLIKKYEKINFIVKYRNLESVKWMYRDLEKMTFLVVQKEKQVDNYIKNNNITNCIKIGHEYRDKNINFDQAFYKQFNIDFNKKWDDFYVQRDLNKEKSFFDRFSLKENNYVVMHEDPYNPRGCYIINRRLLPKNIDIFYITRNLTDNIFDYCYTIENAKEIHIIESSFLFLIDVINTKGKLYDHKYARSYPIDETPTLKKDWNILI